jgi:hypothetical protein
LLVCLGLVTAGLATAAAPEVAPPVCTGLSSVADGAVDVFEPFEGAPGLFLGGVALELDTSLDLVRAVKKLGLATAPEVAKCPAGRVALWLPGFTEPDAVRRLLTTEAKRAGRLLRILKVVGFSPSVAIERLRARCPTEAACASVARTLASPYRCLLVHRWASRADVDACQARPPETTECVLWALLGSSTQVREACLARWR